MMASSMSPIRSTSCRTSSRPDPRHLRLSATADGTRPPTPSVARTTARADNAAEEKAWTTGSCREGGTSHVAAYYDMPDYSRYSDISVGDIDRNNSTDIVLSTASAALLPGKAVSLRVVNGTQIAQVEYPGYPEDCFPILADVDGDRVPEIIYGTFAYQVSAFEGLGGMVPGWPIRGLPGFVDKPLPFKDLNHDGNLDIVIPVRSYAPGTEFPTEEDFQNLIYCFGTLGLRPYAGLEKQSWPTYRGGMSRSGKPMRRGDVNNDEMTDLADPQYLLNYLFSGEPAPIFFEQADMNEDWALGLDDAIILLDELF